MSATDEGMDLTDDEAKALARRLIARQIADGDWLDWGDVPELGERAFGKLLAQIEAYGKGALIDADRQDRADDIDSRDLLERAS